MKASIPSLSLDGFINNKSTQVGKLFLYFLSSKYSQSSLFYKQIASLDYILATNTNASNIKSAVQSNLEMLYNNHFDKSEFNIDVETPQGTGNINIYITGNITDENKTYTLYKEIKVVNGDIESYNNMLDQFYAEYMGES